MPPVCPYGRCTMVNLCKGSHCVREELERITAMKKKEDEHDDQIIVDCAHCKVPILTFWAPNNGGLVRGEYVIVADWMYHPKCWQKVYERFPRG